MDKKIMFRYCCETHDKYHATNSLDCYEYAIANGIKSKFGNEINMYNIFAKDITLRMTIDENNNINLGMNYHPNQHIYIDRYENSSLEILEQLLDKNEIVLISTLHHEIKFFKYYNTPYSTEHGMPIHWLSIVHHDSEYLYYVENPDLINYDNYSYYRDNKTVGVISKKYMKKFFDRYLLCVKVHIDFERLDIFTDRLLQILKTIVATSEKKKTTNGGNEYYGITVIEKLIDVCLGESEIYNRESSEEFSYGMVDATRFIFQARIYMKECLMNFVESKTNITKDEIFDAFEPAIEAWIIVHNIFLKRHIMKQSLLSRQMIKCFSQLILHEKQIISCMGKILLYI